MKRLARVVIVLVLLFQPAGWLQPPAARAEQKPAAASCDDPQDDASCSTSQAAVEVRGPVVTGAIYIRGGRATLMRQQSLSAGCGDCAWTVRYICNDARPATDQDICLGGSDRCNRQLVHVELSIGGLPPTTVEEYCPQDGPVPRPVALTPLTNTLLQRAAEQEKAVAPSVRYQPRGGAVTQLATYFAVDGASRAPVQFQVAVPQAPEIRMTVTATPRSWTWDFGDRSPSLSTTDPGGDYPDGKVTHTYRQRGEVTVTTTSTSSVSWTLVSPYGGLPGATLAQPATSPTTMTALRVREARAQLTH